MAFPLTVPQASRTGNPTKIVVSNVPTPTQVIPSPRVWNMLQALPWSARTGKTRIVCCSVPQPIRVGSPAIRQWSPLVLLGEFPAEINYGQWWPRGGRDRP